MARHVDAKDPSVSRILQASGVRYRKSTATVGVFNGPVSMNSYWDGGSKDEYALVNLATLEVWSMPTSHPYFDRNPDGERIGNVELNELPPGVVLVEGGPPSIGALHTQQPACGALDSFTLIFFRGQFYSVYRHDDL